MRTLSASFQAEIEAGRICRIVRVTLNDGSVFGITNHSKAFTIGAVTFEPAPADLTGKLTSNTGAQIDNQTMKSAWLNHTEQDVIEGAYDDAVVEPGIAAWALDPVEEVSLGKYDIGKLAFNRDGFQAVLMDTMRALGNQVGGTIGPGCDLVFGSPRCGVDLGPLTVTGTVTDAGDTRTTFTDSSRTEAEHWFTDGMIRWTSGDNADGKWYWVEISNAGAITLKLPTKKAMQLTDAYEMTPGCDHTPDGANGCRVKFSNGDNFGGDPFLREETSIQ